jgi:hypothetical protein
MNKSQMMMMLTTRLARVTTADHARAVLQRALRSTGLTYTDTLRDADVDALLQGLAAEGGAIQTLAEQLAVDDDRGPRAA